MRVVYEGATDEQVRWGGCDDPRHVLVEGMEYVVTKKEVHSWHTKFVLDGVSGKFNSVCFREV